ncbi:hypothetical protein EUTSA_v10006412mg [Eutrema salsugineum]|uniref:MATH domain-containing protein n=1 Tax=Eutrema salsugineum TaxID=72664 RepID=V4LWH7_EUTSA|nr:hypothetical protein EUTSA_v10006412mg [Eutrema salsugineum]
MGKEVDKKFSWVIKNFCSVRAKKIYSDEFVVDGCKWRLLAFPKGNNVECLSLYLDVACSESLPSGWKRNALLRLSIVNQVSEKLSETKATQHWFDATSSDWGFTSMFPLSKLHDKDGGFLVNGELNIVASVDVLEVIGKLDVPDESEEATKSLSKLEEDDGAKSSDFLEEASPVESVNSLFEKHPNIASKLRPKNPHLRTTYLNVLLSLTEILSKSPEALSNGDLADAYSSLRYVAMAGFKLDWLEKKLKEAGESRMQEIEEE